MAELESEVQKEVVQDQNNNNNEQQSNDTEHDLSIPDTKTGNDALDKRLEELANASDRNGPKKVEADTNKQLSNGQAVDAKGTQAQPKASVTVQQQQPNVGVGGWAGKAPRAYGPRFNWDAKGNVIDKTTGNVIAQAGADRKSFERMLPIINNATLEADKYKGMYESATKANTVAASLGLTPEEFSIGGRIMAQWKADPKKALAFMLKEAQNNGVDVSDLGVAGGGGMSREEIRNAIKEVAEEVVKPFGFITEERQQQIEHREAMEQANGVIEEFYGSFPDAKVHEESLAKIMGARPNTSLNEAYLILKNHALENKLDWTKDLVPQLQAIHGQVQGTAPKGNGQPANQQRQLPNMTGRTGSPAIVPQKNGAMGGDTSSGNIVKEAMRAAGMDVSNV
jgi:hypothetical protein